MIADKATKLGRAMRARLRLPGALAMFWHIGFPNFGDDINPSFFERLAGVRIRLSSRGREHFLGIGSILAKATPQSTVLGSGFLDRPDGLAVRPRKTIAVRGELSRRALAGAADALLGDPLVLADRMVAQPAKTRRVAYLPHCRNVRRAIALYGDNIAIIDPRRPPFQVIADIAACEKLMSQSLHGLIVADAFAVPNLWIAPHDGMHGRFKFDDYFSTLDQPKTMHAEAATFIREPPRDAFAASEFLHDKNRLAAALAGALAGTGAP